METINEITIPNTVLSIVISKRKLSGHCLVCGGEINASLGSPYPKYSQYTKHEWLPSESCWCCTCPLPWLLSWLSSGMKPGGCWQCRVSWPGGGRWNLLYNDYNEHCRSSQHRHRIREGGKSRSYHNQQSSFFCLKCLNAYVVNSRYLYLDFSIWLN